jgi:histidinol dehydrogenase
VNKIVGPGNKYVMIAKTIVAQDVAIDSPAGPSEVLVLADETADPRCVAADMISQAEHTPDSASGLITTSTKLAKQVQEALGEMVPQSKRSEIVEQSLSTYGFIVTCGSAEEMVELGNVFAPEHLEIISANPQSIAEKITSAGLSCCDYTPVA